MKFNEAIQKIIKRENLIFHSQNDSIQISTIYKNNTISGYEIIIRITSQCNLQCEFCFVKHEVIYFKNDKLLKLIDIISEINLEHSIITISGGEPSTHPEIAEIIKKVIKTGAKIRIQTNALNIVYLQDLEKFHEKIELFISLPSGNKKTYEKITKKDTLNTVSENIRHLSEKFHIIINHVLYKRNYSEFKDLIELINTFNTKNIILNLSNLGLTYSFSYQDKLERYEKIIKTISKHIEENTGININFTLGGGCGFPFCTILKIPRINLKNLILSDKSIISIEKTNNRFYKKKICSSCRFNDYCQGFLKEYIMVFGDSEISPIK